VTRQPVHSTARHYVGIDPGLTGVVAIVTDMDGVSLDVRTHNIPTMQVTKKSGKGKATRYDLQGMIAILEPLRGLRVIAGLEELSGRPGLSSQSVFGMGRGFGIWEGLLASMHIPMVSISPLKWKRALDVMGKSGQDDKSRKAESVLKAQQIFPWVKFPLQRDHNKADAVLLAEFMRRNYPL